MNIGFYSNTFRLFYRQGVSNFYTVDDFGNLKYITFDTVVYVIAGVNEGI